MPHTTQRRSLSFDARSVMLFAALTVGGTLAQAQSATPSAPSGTRAAAQANTNAAAPGKGQPSYGPSSSSPTFDLADANKDGKLSRDEVSRLSAVKQRFDALDTDKDGALSRSEFLSGKVY